MSFACVQIFWRAGSACDQLPFQTGFHHAGHFRVHPFRDSEVALGDQRRGGVVDVLRQRGLLRSKLALGDFAERADSVESFFPSNDSKAVLSWPFTVSFAPSGSPSLATRALRSVLMFLSNESELDCKLDVSCELRFW